LKKIWTNSHFLAKWPFSFFGFTKLFTFCIILSSCANAQNAKLESARSTSGNVPSTAPAATSAPTIGDSEVIRAQQLQLVKVPLTVTARVKKMLKYDDRGLPHERFLLVLSNGSTILVAHNTKMAPYVPVQPGDIVTVSGEYIWNAKGGLIHWTHHSDSPNHQSGFIEFNGKRYE